MYSSIQIFIKSHDISLKNSDITIFKTAIVRPLDFHILKIFTYAPCYLGSCIFVQNFTKIGQSDA